jgi:hypothetical protein
VSSAAEHSVIGIVTAVMLTFVAAAALAEPATTRCVPCHSANGGAVSSHVAEWKASAHAQKGIGCDRCHGGDPATYEPTLAHRGVVSAAGPRSPVHRDNISSTCGRCHYGEARAFSESLHQTLVLADERRAPECTACHGAMGGRVLSPAALEVRCAACHTAASARRAYPARMRASVEALSALRLRADILDDVVARVADRERRIELLVALYDARASARASVASLHAFDLDNLGERLSAARRELDAVALAAVTLAR